MIFKGAVTRQGLSIPLECAAFAYLKLRTPCLSYGITARNGILDLVVPQVFRGLSTRSFEDQPSIDMKKIRNVAIIAHVDHGKTTLVDKLLQHAGAVQLEQGQRVMDSNTIEKERGITIMSKITSFEYNGYLINVVDTPGHSDFGGEVERVLSMVDGVCLLVCSTEGPMPQTRYVLKKALQNSLKPLVIINKVDRETSRVDEIECELLDMFINFDVNDEQLNYSILYASARDGWAVKKIGDSRVNVAPIIESIIENIPEPRCEPNAPFSMLVTQLEESKYFGRACIGLIRSGTVSVGDVVKLMPSSNQPVAPTYTVSKLAKKKGLEIFEPQKCVAGDIVYVYGLPDVRINDTVCAPEVETALPFPTIDPPTISVVIYPNDSPFAGKEGKHITTNTLRERLMRESVNNVSISVTELVDAFELKGRGEIQISVLLETMRREGYELGVSSPRVLYDTRIENGTKVVYEPVEEVTVEIDAVAAGNLIGKLEKRKGVMVSYTEQENKVKLVYLVPTRGLLGLPSEIKAESGGTATILHTVHSYQRFKGDLELPKRGLIISTHTGTVTAFALQSLENRGIVFCKPGDEVYTGSIIGETCKGSDLEFNPAKIRTMSNFRASSRDEYVKGPPYVNLPIESMLTMIGPEDALEVTPKVVRMRKLVLDARERRSQNRKMKNFYTGPN